MWSGMSQADRDTIQRNIKILQAVDVSLLAERLIQKKVIDGQFIERITSTFKTKQERNQEFFLRYMKRGPTAFDILVTALKESGHFAEAGALCGEESPESSSSSSNASSSERSQVLLDISGSIKIAAKYNNGLGPEAYPMMSHPRGFALIINNIDFPNDPTATRTGAKADTQNLTKLFTDLGFVTSHHHNASKSKLTQIFKQFIAQFETQVDACIVAILSHGHDHDYLRTSDPGHTYVNLYKDVIRHFDNVNCPLLFQKPKIFIVQACRGDNKDLGYYRRTQVDGRDLGAVEQNVELGSDPQLFPSVTDILVCYSTVPGFVSNRDTELGTWYIQTLCETFREHCHNLEIGAMLKKVGVRIGSVNSENKEKQMSSFKNMGFNREFYFNPGLYCFGE